MRNQSFIYLQKIDLKCTIKPTHTDKHYLRFKLQQPYICLIVQREMEVNGAIELILNLVKDLHLGSTYRTLIKVSKIIQDAKLSDQIRVTIVFKSKIIEP